MHRFLRNIKLLSAIGFGLLIVTIWTFGHVFGLNTIEQRLTAIVAIMLTWVFTLLIGRLLAARAGTLVERMFRAQLDKAVMQATPEQRAEVALLRKQLLEAIATLKKSNLGRLHGKAALYELPWYMIIGHPAAGKSSAIQNSGLIFPIAENGKNAIRGVGGTRNCDWFFTTDGVLLDTAGRYATQREDHAEWLEFLRLLKAHRTRTPINGILVTISLPELTQYKSENFAEYARQIRARINEIDQAFARKVPVYLIFTKIDLLGGFSQFFEDMTDEQRSQVWGATLPHEQAIGFDAAAAASSEFEDLYRGLSAIGNEKLAASRSNLDRPALFAFPIEFNSMRNAVSRFVEILFEDDPYHTHPLLRGFYFTSALQDGIPKIPAGSRVSARFDLANADLPAKRTPTSQSFFLRDLFRDVIFPDQHLVGRQIKGHGSRARMAGLLTGFMLIAIMGGIWTWSFYQNRLLIDDTARELALFDTPALSDRLTRLNFIQMRLELLKKYREQHRPIAMGFGLYQGEKLAHHLQQLYAAEVTTLLLGPVQQDLETRLGTLSSDVKTASTSAANLRSALSNEQYYDTLKTYLMLHNRQRLETPYLREQLAQRWREWLEHTRGSTDMDEIGPLAEHVIAYYIENLPQKTTPTIDNKELLISDSREVLNNAMRKLSAKDRIYGEIVARASSKYTGLNINRILDNTDVDLMSNGYTVPAAYTRSAWEGHIRQAIEEASRGTLKDDDWVLENASANQQLSAADFEKNYIDLLTMYKAAYAREWINFTAGLSINNFRNLGDAVTRVDRLSDFKQSPIRRIFVRIAHETSWDNPQLLQASARKEDSDLKAALVKRLLTDDQASNSQRSPNQVGELEDRFGLFDRLTSESGGSPGLTPYLSALGKMKSRLESINSSGEPGKSARTLMKNTIESSGSELVEGVQIVEGQLLAGADTELRSLLKPMLLRPFTSSYGALLPLANNDINQSWKRQVLPHWQALADKYPFIESGNEAQLSDISKFLESDDGALNKFINETLDGLLARQGNVYVPRRWGNMSVPFTSLFLSGITHASDIGQNVFIAGGESRFELQPVPTPGLSEVVLDIDGQQLRYRNGPQLWTAFNWPAAQTAQGAKISVITFAGVASTVLSNPGRMGWMRMVSQARTTGTTSGTTQLVWMVNSPDNKSGEKIPVRFNLRLVSGANPFAMNTLRDLKLPNKIVN